MDQEIEDLTVKQELLVLSHQSLRQSNSPLSPLRVSSPTKREADPDSDRDLLELKRRKRGSQATNDSTVKTYEDLLSKEINECLGGNFEDTKDFRAAGNAKSDGSTQHGAVRWSPEEKLKFFHCLDRKGRHDLPGISNGIGTKSQPEVADYLHLLRTAHRDRHLRSDRLDLYRYEDLPAATEIGEDLCTLLDAAAAKLTDTELRRSLKREKRKYDDRAIIHYDLAKELYDRAVPDVDSSPPSRGTLDFAIALLNVSQMLELSAYIFMNSKHDHDNWMHIAPVEGVPRILATCLIDICNLVVSVTERIVSSANFLAMSRIRAAGSRSDRDTEQVVTRADVLTAVEILDMPPNSWEFWARCPRKCQLRIVLEDRQASDSEEELSYSTIEKTLLQSAGRDPRPMSSSEADTDDLLSEGSDASMSSVSLSHQVSRPEFRTRTSSRSSSQISHISRVRTSSGTRSVSVARSSSNRRSMSTDVVDDSDSDSDPSFDDLERRELADDEFADAVDADNRKSEENMLCQVINAASVDIVGDQSNVTASTSRARSQSTLRPRKQAKDLDDWVNWCRYQAKWECYPSPLPLDVPAETMLREPSQGIGSERSVSSDRK